MADGGKMSAEEFKLRLQLETSLLVWVRTSLGLMGFGFVVARFGLFLREITTLGETRVHPHPRLATMNAFAGTGLIVMGVAVLILAVFVHRRMVDRLEKGESAFRSRWSLGVFLAGLLAAMGGGIAVYLTFVEL
jgi:putative membrane protein